MFYLQNACVLANDHKEVSPFAPDVVRVVEHNGQVFRIWNTRGQERFIAIIPGIKSADCVLLCPRSLEDFAYLLKMVMPDLTGGRRGFDESLLSAEQQRLARQLAANRAEYDGGAAAAPPPPPPQAPQIRCRSAFVIVDSVFFPTDNARRDILAAAGRRGLLTLPAPTVGNRVAILETIFDDLQLSETARLEAQLELAHSYSPGHPLNPENPRRNPAINAALNDGLPVADLMTVVRAYDFRP